MQMISSKPNEAAISDDRSHILIIGLKQELDCLGGPSAMIALFYLNIANNKSHSKVAFKMGSVDKGLPHAGFCPDSQNIHSDAAKIRRFSISSKYF